MPGNSFCCASGGDWERAGQPRMCCPCPWACQPATAWRQRAARRADAPAPRHGWADRSAANAKDVRLGRGQLDGLDQLEVQAAAQVRPDAPLALRRSAAMGTGLPVTPHTGACGLRAARTGHSTSACTSDAVRLGYGGVARTSSSGVARGTGKMLVSKKYAVGPSCARERGPQERPAHQYAQEHDAEQAVEPCCTVSAQRVRDATHVAGDCGSSRAWPPASRQSAAPRPEYSVQSAVFGVSSGIASALFLHAERRGQQHAHTIAANGAINSAAPQPSHTCRTQASIASRARAARLEMQLCVHNPSKQANITAPTAAGRRPRPS